MMPFKTGELKKKKKLKPMQIKLEKKGLFFINYYSVKK